MPCSAAAHAGSSCIKRRAARSAVTTNAAAGRCRHRAAGIEQGQRVVRTQHGVRAHARAAAATLQHPALGQRADIEHEAGESGQFSRSSRRSVKLEVNATRYENAPAVAKAARGQARIAQGADADGEIEAFLDQIDIAVGQMQIERQLRMLGQEVGQCRRDMRQPESARRADAQGAAQRTAERTRGRLGFLQFGQQGFAAGQVRATRLGQADLARGPLQQAHAQPRFERCDRTADRRACKPSWSAARTKLRRRPTSTKALIRSGGCRAFLRLLQ